MRMRSWISHCVLWALLFSLGTATAAAVPAENAKEKRILIINSYGEQTVWSKNVTDKLENRIHEDHPDWMVYSGNLKTESAVYSMAAFFTLRSLIWGYAERTRTSVDATELKSNSLFIQDDIPDAIVWVGEEGFLHYITYVFQLGEWRTIPMVLCSVKDSVSAYGWRPESKFRFDRKFGIREYYVVSTQLYKDDPAVDLYKNLKDIPRRDTIVYGKAAYQYDFYLNYSGNIMQLPIRQNLELIHRLLPGLEELIWVGNDSYRSMETRLEVEKVVGETMPDVKFRKMIVDNMNVDSIYDVMLEPAGNRAFLTYSLNIDALHSRRSDREMDSLFTHVSTVPLFTLTERDFNKDNYWVGGCFLRSADAVNSSLAMLERAVRGDSIMALPFDTISESRIVLNKTALERYGLTRAAGRLEGVSFVHIPPAFLQKYEKQLLITVLILVVAGCYIIISRRRSRYNKHIRADYARYKRLYDKLQVIYENSSIDFALYDEKGKRLLRIVNGKVEMAEGDCDLFSENIFESPCLGEDLKEQIRSRRAVNCEVALDFEGRLSRTKFAEHNVYQLIVKPLHEVSYGTSCFMAIAVNLTPTIRERQEKERFEGLFHFASDSSQVGVVFYHAETAEGMATDSWCGNMNETFVSGTFPAYGQVVGEDREVLLQYQKAIRAGKVLEPLCRDIQVRGKDGGKHWIRQHMYFIQSSRRLIELSLDIDEQKQNEKSLEEAKRKAEESNEETRCFLSSISHEVRTPLNAIVGFSAILAVPDDEESGSEYTSIILRNARLLDALITNILDLSALDGGKVSFHYTRLNVADVFLEMEEYIRNNLYNHPLKVIRELPENEADRFITTDQEYLRVLLGNLISNAVKFTDTGSITLGCRKEDRGFYFHVTDTGCGIAPEDQKYIFNRFKKLDTYIQGTGLGLALCKSIVKHFNGEIGVISEKGEGSTFWFVLPGGE